MAKILLIINNHFAISELKQIIDKSLDITYYLNLNDAYQYIIENGLPDVLIYDYTKDNQAIKNLINSYEKPPFFSIVLFNKFDELMINSYLKESYSDFFILSTHNMYEFVLHLKLLINNINYKKELDKTIIFNEILTTIEVNNLKIKLTRLEFNLFRYLYIKQNEIVTRKEIQENIWKFDEFDFYSRSLDTYIKILRRKLSSIQDFEYKIITIRGTGYSLIKINYT